MATYRCPICQDDVEIIPTVGYEIVSTYCLAHRAAFGGVSPVRREPVLAGEGADCTPDLVGAASP